MTLSTGSCVVCQRRDPRRGFVCGPCRSRIDEQLHELVERWVIVPAAMEPAREERQRVSGSRERPMPGGEALNLLARGNVTTRQLVGADQHGTIDPAEILWSWTRDWLTYRHAGEIGPAPDLCSIVVWLRARLEWACDEHPAIDDFASEVWDAVTSLREVLNVRRYIQRYKEPCPRCDSRALYREVDPDRGASPWVECGDCRNLWRESEFARLGVILDAEARRTA